MKNIIFVILITATASTQAFFLEPLFKLKEGAQDQRIAADELSKHRKDITLRKEILLPGRGAEPSIVVCHTKAASKSFDDYIAAEGSLAARIFASQCIDGVILGLLAALFNARFDMSISTTCATIATAIMIVLLQNNALGSVPYFDVRLRRHEYEYKALSMQTLLNVGCILAGAKLSSYMLIA